MSSFLSLIEQCETISRVICFILWTCAIICYASMLYLTTQDVMDEWVDSKFNFWSKAIKVVFILWIIDLIVFGTCLILNNFLK